MGDSHPLYMHVCVSSYLLGVNLKENPGEPKSQREKKREEE